MATSAFNVPASAGSKRDNRFTFRHDGKTYSVPKLQYLSGKTAKLLNELQAPMTSAEINRRVLVSECPDCEDAVYSMADDQMEALADAWIEASTVTVGESQGSNDS